MQFENWLAFCSIAVVATVIPGPAILLISTHSLQFGVLRSLVTAFGNVTGLFVLSTCSVLGVSAVVALSSVAFAVIKIVGAFYLLYLGIKIWRSGVQLNSIEHYGQVKYNAWSLYSQGLLVSLTNPKAIIFTSALFPQFIVVSEPLLPQFVILVFTLMISSLLCLSLYSLLSHKFKKGTNKFISANSLGRIFGATFIIAGGGLVISTQK